MSSEGRPAIFVTAPQIRRSLAEFLRQHLPDLIILAFTELPENRRVEVVATIGGSGALTLDPQLDNSKG